MGVQIRILECYQIANLVIVILFQALARCLMLFAFSIAFRSTCMKHFTLVNARRVGDILGSW